jgi:hypothetical protein
MARFLFRHLKGYRFLIRRRPIHAAPIGTWAPAVAEGPDATFPRGRGTR